MEVTESTHVGYSLLQPQAETQPEHTILSPPDSLLSTLTNLLSCRHLFIEGPSKSGRSSLLMNLSCDLAARVPCRCIGDRPCSCLAVILFLPLSQEEFPLPCQRRHLEDLVRSFPRKLLNRIQIRRIANYRDLLQQLWIIQGAGWHEQPYALLLDGLDRITSNIQDEAISTQNHPNPIQIRSRQSLLSKFLCVPNASIEFVSNIVQLTLKLLS